MNALSGFANAALAPANAIYNFIDHYVPAGAELSTTPLPAEGPPSPTLRHYSDSAPATFEGGSPVGALPPELAPELLPEPTYAVCEGGDPRDEPVISVDTSNDAEMARQAQIAEVEAVIDEAMEELTQAFERLSQNAGRAFGHRVFREVPHLFHWNANPFQGFDNNAESRAPTGYLVRLIIRHG